MLLLLLVWTSLDHLPPDPPPPDPPSAGFSFFLLSLGVRGFTRQPENSKRGHLRVPALQTPPKFHENTPEKDRKKHEILGLPPSGPHLPSPRAAGPHPFGPPTLRVSTPPGTHPSGPSSGGPLGPHFFWFWAPTFLL